jgi:hypothetical protein
VTCPSASIRATNSSLSSTSYPSISAHQRTSACGSTASKVICTVRLMAGTVEAAHDDGETHASVWHTRRVQFSLVIIE